MNLNKLTKAELISKLKDTKKENTVSVKPSHKLTTNYYNLFTSYLWEILNLFNLIKELLFKVTFITFIYKILSKYKLIRRLFLYIYKIVFGVFGFTFLDHFGIIETTSEIWKWIFNSYLRLVDSLITIYNTIKDYLFGGIEEDEEIPEPMMFTRSDTEIVKPDDEPKSVGYTKYVIYSLILATVGIGVIIYHEEIYESGLAAWDWLVNSFRPAQDPGNNPGGINPADNPGGDRPDIQTIIVEGSRPVSPVSDTSVETIRPSYPIAESSSSSSSSITKSNDAKIENLNEIIEENKKLFYERLKLTSYWDNAWKTWLDLDMKKNIEEIDHVITHTPEMLKNSNDTFNKLLDVIKGYNDQLDVISKGKSKADSDTLNNVYQVQKHIRKWICESCYLMFNLQIDENSTEKIDISEIIKS